MVYSKKKRCPTSNLEAVVKAQEEKAVVKQVEEKTVVNHITDKDGLDWAYDAANDIAIIDNTLYIA